ncbi:endonuclease [Pontibacter populi]|uniref:Endonuclease n=1 Tax=Pontibacter populi TaxID=890055 RepID=A0ABV1RX84_9BACT
MKRILLAFSILLSATLQLVAQTAPPANLSGNELKTWLKTNWYDGKHNNLSYSTARGKMYNYIDNYDNKVTCVYSGYQETKAYSESNTSTTMSNINCEHSIPQSWFGSSTPMVSDIHHLYPTVIQWNSDRGSDPFAEIPDNTTTKWIRGTTSQTTIPAANISEYSEDTNSQFEPREDHKGNLARTAFYFYTMYPTQAGNITRLADINTLYQWHLQDPVDDRERERNRRTEIAQGNRNPYIDYPELVAKAWGLTPVNCSPATQLTSLTAAQKTTSTITLNWANGSGDRRLIVVKEGSAANLAPTGSYTGINSDFTAATDQGNGNRIVYYNSGSSVTITGLKANTAYYVQAFEACSSDNTYNTTNAPTITVTTPDYACTGVPTAVTAVTSGSVTQSGFNLSWTNGSGDGRIVVVRKGEAPAFKPQAGITYNGASANYATATTLTDGSKLIYNGAGNEVVVAGLEAGSLYFVQVFESCSNGYQYETATAPSLAVTTAAANNPPTGNGNVIAIQNFNGTANDGWVVTSGFSSSTINTGLPDGQRIKTGASLQVSNATKEVVLADVNTTGKQDVYFELYNSSVSVTTGNGFDTGDYLEVYVALNGADFSTTPDIKITGNASDNNIRYGMDGTATITTAAGTPTEKIFTEKLTSPNVLAADKAPSVLRVTIPNGTTSVKAKVNIKNNSSNEVWNVEDVALYAAASAPADCDEFTLEGHAGEDKTLYVGQAVTIGGAAVAGYTYSWSPATGLSDATLANPTITFTTPGTYVYTLAATKEGCVSTDQVTLTVQAITAPTANDVTICAGQTATLTVANAVAEFTYKWYDAETAGTLLHTGVTYTTSQLTATTSYYVEAVNAAGVASTRTKATVNVASGNPEAATITGQNVVCPGETVTYTANAQSGITSYSWSVPEGWTIVSGGNTAQLTVVAGTTAGNVSITVANNCGGSTATDLAVTITTPIADNTISEVQTICAGQAPATINGSAATGGNGTYTYQWQTSTDGTNFVPAAGVNNSQNYSAGALNATTYIRRKVTSGTCGESISAAIKITVNAAPAKPTISQQANQLTASVAGSGYEWAKDGVTIAGATTQTITITEAGSYTVRVQNEAGCYSVISDAVQATVQPTAIEDEIASGVIVAPNPARGKFSISTEVPLQQAEVIITNLLGSVVYRATLPVLQDKLDVDLSRLPAGLYVVQLQAKQLKVVRKVLVTK